MASSETIYEAAETFVADINGTPVTVEKGKTRVTEDDPVYRANPHFFKPLQIRTRVEQATAAPGEKRRRSAA